MGKVADFIESSDKAAVSQFQGFIPIFVSIMQKCLASGDDDGCQKIFEVFDELMVLEAPILSKHFTDLVDFFLTIAANTQYSDEVRNAALSFLVWCIMSSKSKISKSRLLPNIISTMFTIAAEEEIDNRDEDCPSRLAIQVINSVSSYFAPQQIFPVVMQNVVKCIQSHSFGDRKAAMLAIAVLVEGCVDFMRSNLEEVFQIVVHAMHDQNSVVRKSACMALAALVYNFEDEMGEKHATLMPLLFNMISDPDPTVHPEALGSLDILLEGMGDEILQYLPVLMSKLLMIWGQGSLESQVTTINCVGSIAHASGREFAPHFPQVLSNLSQAMSLHDLDSLKIRSAATECIGPVATAVGKDEFRQYLPGVMESVVQGMSQNSTDLKQSSYVLFGILGPLFGEEFAPYLQFIVPPLLECCAQVEKNDGFDVDAAEEALELGEELDKDSPSFASGIAQEKEYSIDTLAELFASTKSAFMPYLAETINVAMPLLDHYHESVRSSASAALLRCFETAFKMNHPGDWKEGLPLETQLHENVMNIGKLAIESILCMLAEEDDR
jgi:hypothetical protein